MWTISNTKVVMKENEVNTLPYFDQSMVPIGLLDIQHTNSFKTIYFSCTRYCIFVDFICQFKRNFASDPLINGPLGRGRIVLKMRFEPKILNLLYRSLSRRWLSACKSHISIFLSILLF